MRKNIKKLDDFLKSEVSMQGRACVRNLGAVYSIEETSGPQNLQVSIVLKASKSAGAKDDVPKIYGFVHQLHRC